MSSHLMEVREREVRQSSLKIHPSNHFSFIFSLTLIIHNNKINDDEFKKY